ncbi:MAG: AAA family ATPase [Chloroflexi bacterium]|nr:AAA family ATPase [Chloroflexota bacterium]
MKVVAIVGMAGSGKSEVARIFEQSGFARVRFGDITDEEMARRGLPPNESSERLVRESLRQEHGMVAYAKLNLPKIDAFKKQSNVVCDGLYSWEEYTFFRDYYGPDFVVIAVYASPKTRYARLARRVRRPLTPEESASRDRSEIENVNKGGPMAMADFTLVNEGPLEDLRQAARRTVETLL